MQWIRSIFNKLLHNHKVIPVIYWVLFLHKMEISSLLSQAAHETLHHSFIVFHFSSRKVIQLKVICCSWYRFRLLSPSPSQEPWHWLHRPKDLFPLSLLLWQWSSAYGASDTETNKVKMYLQGRGEELSNFIGGTNILCFSFIFYHNVHTLFIFSRLEGMKINLYVTTYFINIWQ